MKITTIVAACTLAALTACATKVDKSAAPADAAGTASTAPAPAAAALTPVKVPATSAKRLVLNLSGPKFVTDAKDWASFKEEWRATFADHAKGAGVAFSLQDGDARPIGSNGTLVSVYVNDYRMVGIGSRIFFGVMTGNAYIDAKVSFMDLNDGAAFGAQLYNTSSSAGQGIFGKMTPQQVDAIAAEVFAELKAR